MEHQKVLFSLGRNYIFIQEGRLCVINGVDYLIAVSEQNNNQFFEKINLPWWTGVQDGKH